MHDRTKLLYIDTVGCQMNVLDSELVRYLGLPGQAISYKLGERAWLDGREAARRARGADFDLKAWHMAALSQGSIFGCCLKSVNQEQALTLPATSATRTWRVTRGA